MRAGWKKDRIAVLCFTARGCDTAGRIRDILTACGAEIGVADESRRSEDLSGKPTENMTDIRLWCKKKDFAPPAGIMPLAGGLREWAGKRFADSDLLIFVGAAGIAVRAIAPFVESKRTDPAVLCVDEGATYVISLLSGHIGGANEQALLLAEGLHAMPVITTATDVNGKFAVDVFARANGLFISDMTLAKEISAALLDGRRVKLSSEFLLEGQIPPELELTPKPELLPEPDLLPEPNLSPEPELKLSRKPDLSPEPDGESSPFASCGIHIGIRRRDGRASAASVRTAAADRTLYLVPKIVTLGIGCRKGKDPAALFDFVREILSEHGILPEAVEQIVSIDLKEREAAIRSLAEAHRVPFRVFSAETLRRCPGSFSASSFVSSQVGVDNVCERSAVLGSGGTLLFSKQARDGMTLAAAVREWRAYFE